MIFLEKWCCGKCGPHDNQAVLYFENIIKPCLFYLSFVTNESLCGNKELISGHNQINLHLGKHVFGTILRCAHIPEMKLMHLTVTGQVHGIFFPTIHGAIIYCGNPE